MRRHLGRARAPSKWSCRSGLRPHRSNDGSLGSSGVASQILTSPLKQLRLRVFDKCFRHFAVTRGERAGIGTVLPRYGLACRATAWNLGPSRLAGRLAMMADENGAAARSFHLFLPLFRRLGSALSLARPPWRERRTYVADSQHHWAIPVEQAQRAHTPHA